MESPKGLKFILVHLVGIILFREWTLEKWNYNLKERQNFFTGVYWISARKITESSLFDEMFAFFQNLGCGIYTAYGIQVFLSRIWTLKLCLFYDLYDIKLYNIKLVIKVIFYYYQNFNENSHNQFLSIVDDVWLKKIWLQFKTLRWIAATLFGPGFGWVTRQKLDNSKIGTSYKQRKILILSPNKWECLIFDSTFSQL